MFAPPGDGLASDTLEAGERRKEVYRRFASRSRSAQCSPAAPPVAHAADAISEQEAHAIGVTAYIYLYPLVTMDVTRKQLTNVAKAEGIAAPMNEFANMPRSRRRI